MMELNNLFDKPFDALLTSVSILTATAGWLFAAWQERRLSRRSHTLDILLAQDTNADLARALDQGEELAPNEISDVKQIPVEVRRALNFYDFMCAAARYKTLDRQLIVRTMRFRLLRMYHLSLPMLRLARRGLGNQKICEDFEWFVLRKLGYKSWAQTVDKHGRPLASDKPASDARADPIGVKAWRKGRDSAGTW